jgi:hypothetical protein
VLSAVGLSAPTVAVDYSADLGAASFAGQNAAAYLAQIEDTEQAPIFVDPTGQVIVLPRYWWQDPAWSITSAATFSDDGSGIAYAGGGLSIDGDTASNDVAVTSTVSGVEAVGRDSAAVSAYGRRSEQIVTQARTDIAAQGVADGVITRFATPRVLVDPWTVTPGVGTSPAWATILGLDIGDRVTVERTPASTGSQSVRSVLLDGVAHETDVGSAVWRVTFRGSPAPTPGGVSDGQYWRLSTSKLGGTTEPKTRLGY